MPNGKPALCDAGPLVALYDFTDASHAVCGEVLRELRTRLLTTWPVLTEAMYLLEQPRARDHLWDFILRGGVRPVALSDELIPRMRGLMEKYADLPMSLADASLVALAEHMRITRIFSLDHHFRLYRPHHTRAFEIIP